MKKNRLICTALTFAAMTIGILIFIESGTENSNAKRHTVVRPSEQFAEIVARGWPSSAIAKSPYSQGYESDQVIIPNVNFELTIFDGSYYSSSGPDHWEPEAYEPFPRNLDSEVEEFLKKDARPISYR